MISIQQEDFDLDALVELARRPEAGAIVVFNGIVRGDDILDMEIEAYREMAVKELERIAHNAKEKYCLASVSIVHRIGRLKVGDNILAIVVSAAHRHEAYEGSRYIIEEIKACAPLWKKERCNNGERWVEG